jgi:hypothetical protein
MAAATLRVRRVGVRIPPGALLRQTTGARSYGRLQLQAREGMPMITRPEQVVFIGDVDP